MIADRGPESRGRRRGVGGAGFESGSPREMGSEREGQRHGGN
jgi:hypothetical protein